MTKEILNRVEKSGIVTIDFDEFQTPKILVIDIKDWLNDGLYLMLNCGSMGPSEIPTQYMPIY